MNHIPHRRSEESIMYRRITIAAVAAITTLALTACGGDDKTPDSATNTTGTSAAAESSDNGPVVDRITDALDKLDVEWDSLADPTYNAAANSDVRDINIGGYSAVIHEFRTEESAKSWSDASDTLGGIHVAFANSAVSLNSEEGREASEKLAPRLAGELGGEAHVADDPMAALDDLTSELNVPSNGPRPTPAAAPSEPTATCALDPIYEAGTTFYSDGTSDFTTACFDQFMTTNGTGNNYTSPNTGGDPSTWDYDGPRTENGDPSEHPQVQWANCLDEFGLEYCQENDPSGF